MKAQTRIDKAQFIVDISLEQFSSYLADIDIQDAASSCAQWPVKDNFEALGKLVLEKIEQGSTEDGTQAVWQAEFNGEDNRTADAHR